MSYTSAAEPAVVLYAPLKCAGNYFKGQRKSRDMRIVITCVDDAFAPLLTQTVHLLQNISCPGTFGSRAPSAPAGAAPSSHSLLSVSEDAGMFPFVRCSTPLSPTDENINTINRKTLFLHTLKNTQILYTDGYRSGHAHTYNYNNLSTLPVNLWTQWPL